MSDEKKQGLETGTLVATHATLASELRRASNDLKHAAIATAGGAAIALAGNFAAQHPDSELTQGMVEAQKTARIDDSSPQKLGEEGNMGGGVALLAAGAAVLANRNRKRYAAAKGEAESHMSVAGVEPVGDGVYRLKGGTILEVPEPNWSAKSKAPKNVNERDR